MEFRQIENNSSAVAELLEQNNLSRSGLTDNNVFLFALFKGDEILGAGALTVIDTFSMLRSVCINKKYQKNRLGSDLCGQGLKNLLSSGGFRLDPPNCVVGYVG
mgnify:CR=1 FL=1